MLSSAFVAVLAVAAPFLAVSAPVQSDAASSLQVRARYVGCSVWQDCTDMPIVENSHHWCHWWNKQNRNVCDWDCNEGYYRKNNKCFPYAPAATTTTEQAWSAPAETQAAAAKVELASTSDNNVLASVSAFKGVNTGAIASWFHTNSGSDSTNGHSWCYTPYNDNTPGMAISYKTMVNAAGGDEMAARKMFCGLEAEVTTPEGRTATLYVADAFDDTWVLTPTSIDVVYNAFAQLFGRTTDNKNDVVQNVSWKFTGNRNSRYAFNGEGN
ncbi:hypothetical protein JCM8115_002325 [Rhodotorula mucilaginosa]|uniref:Uncharacterized protein n=1 Tax=Rhodotorula mucilaginosa TaxID=5537 RepID=A0A9P7B3A5_RHOMI|nr:hypothetical protein C6P46_000528 [Rhodotorula mucilaginosa]